MRGNHFFALFFHFLVYQKVIFHSLMFIYDPTDYFSLADLYFRIKIKNFRCFSEFMVFRFLKAFGYF